MKRMFLLFLFSIIIPPAWNIKNWCSAVIRYTDYTWCSFIYIIILFSFVIILWTFSLTISKTISLTEIIKLRYIFISNYFWIFFSDFSYFRNLQKFVCNILSMNRQYELGIHIINKMIGISNKTFIKKFVVILSKVIRFFYF